MNQTIYANYVGFVTWLLLIFLNHFHHLLPIFSSRNLTIIVAFVDIFSSFFASNGVFANYFLDTDSLFQLTLFLAYGNSRATPDYLGIDRVDCRLCHFQRYNIKIPKTHS